MWYWWQDQYTDQQNRIENSEIDPYEYTQLRFDKSTKANHRGNMTFATNVLTFVIAIGHVSNFIKRLTPNGLQITDRVGEIEMLVKRYVSVMWCENFIEI